MTTEEILEEACFRTLAGSPHPFYVVQLNSTRELTLNGHYVSDALVDHIKRADPPFTHVFLQTHGWNTPKSKAVRIPFSEFMAGMQNDPNVPTDDSFNPLFIGFTWEAVPYRIMQAQDALEKAQLVEESLQECEMQDEKLVTASRGLLRAVETNDPKDKDVRSNMRALIGDESDDEDDNDGAIDEINKLEEEEEEEDAEPYVTPRGLPIPKFVYKLLGPFEKLVFGRLIARGRRTGRVLQEIIANLMLARPDPTVKYCLMANSLGAHVVSGALTSPSMLPYKLHCAFIVQGAASSEWFGSGGKYESVRENVAGPVVCTVSLKDHLLRNAFKPFHGEAVGNCGFPVANQVQMLSRDEFSRGAYKWNCGDWNNVEGTRFIDEGSPFAGGHGDFKEDETTMTYWSAINCHVDKEKYYTARSPEVVGGGAEIAPAEAGSGAPAEVEKSEQETSKSCVVM